MTNLSKWNVTIEYGPIASMSHDIVVLASSAKDAKSKAKKWAEDNNVESPLINEPYEEDSDAYEDYLEWTEAEEEEFMSIVNHSKDSDEI